MALSPTERALTRLLAGLAVLILAGSAQPYQISQSGYGAYEASLTVSRSQRAAAWYDTRDGHPEIYFRMLDSDGRAAGPERRITTGSDFAYEPDIAAVSGNFALAWYERNPTTGRLRAKLGFVTRDGRLLWVKPLSQPDRDGRNPVVRLAGGEVFCAWLEGAAGQDPEVWAAWFDVAGRSLRAARRIAAAGRTTWNLNAAVDNQDSVWIAFDATVGTQADELFLARVGKVGDANRRVSADDGFPSKYPDLAFSENRAALTWFDERHGNQEVYLVVSPADKVADEVDGRARRITNTPGESIGAYLAWNGSQLGLAWCDNTEGQHEVYVEPFDSEGRPLQPPTRLTHTITESLIPAIRPWRNGFALVWNEFQPGAGGAHDPNGRSEVMFRFVERS